MIERGMCPAEDGKSWFSAIMEVGDNILLDLKW